MRLGKDDLRESHIIDMLVDSLIGRQIDRPLAASAMRGDKRKQRKKVHAGYHGMIFAIQCRVPPISQGAMASNPADDKQILKAWQPYPTTRCQ